MKITQIKAYAVDTPISDISRDISGPYLRIDLYGTILWYACNSPKELFELSGYFGKSNKLEQEFRDTYGVMHEQLELFDE